MPRWTILVAASNFRRVNPTLPPRAKSQGDALRRLYGAALAAALGPRECAAAYITESSAALPHPSFEEVWPALVDEVINDPKDREVAKKVGSGRKYARDRGGMVYFVATASAKALAAGLLQQPSSVLYNVNEQLQLTELDVLWAVHYFWVVRAVSVLGHELYHHQMGTEPFPTDSALVETLRRAVREFELPPEPAAESASAPPPEEAVV